MKTTETTKTNVQTSTGPTIGDLINKAKLTNPEGGSINLDDIEKSLKLSRAETVEICKNTPGAIFKAGRKGNSSVILYGKNAKEFVEERNARQQHTKNPIKRHYNKSSEATTNEAIHTSFRSPVLKITVGGNTKTIPIELSLAEA